MSLHTLATHMAQTGRGPDSMLVHMSPREVQSLQTLAKAHGGTMTINPHTGLPEAGFLDSLLPMILGIVLAPETGGASLGITSAWETAAVVGGLTGLATGSLSKGLMAGFGAYGGAGIGGSLAGAGVSQTAAEQLVKEGTLSAADANGLVAPTSVSTLTPSAQYYGPGAEGLPPVSGTPVGPPSTGMPFDPSSTGANTFVPGADGMPATGMPGVTPPVEAGMSGIPNEESIVGSGPGQMSQADYTKLASSSMTPEQLAAAKQQMIEGIKNGTVNPMSSLGKGIQGLTDTGGWGKFASNNWKPLASAGVAALLNAPPNTVKGGARTPEGYIRPAKYDPYTGTYSYADPVKVADWGNKNISDYTHAKGGLMGLANGGAVAFADGGGITDEQRAFIDWQAKQTDPLQQNAIADQWARAGITDPYSNAALIANAQAMIDRGNSRMSLVNGTGDTSNQFPSPNPPTAAQVAPWNDPDWQKYLGTNKEAYNLGMQVKNDPAFAAQFAKEHGYDTNTLNAWVTAATDPYAAAVQSANTPSNFVAGPTVGPGSQTPVDISQIRRPGEAITAGQKYSQQYNPDQLTGIRDLWYQYSKDPTTMSTALNQFGFTPDDLGLALGMSKTQVQKYFTGQTVPTAGNQTTTKGLEGINTQQLNAKNAYDMLDTQGRRQLFSDWAKQNDVYGMSSPGMTADDGSFTPWATSNPITVQQSKALDASYKKMIDDYNAAHPYTPFSLQAAQAGTPTAGTPTAGTPTVPKSGIQTLTAGTTAPTTPAPAGIQQLTKDGHLVDPTTGHLLNPTLDAATLKMTRDGINTNAEMTQAYNGYWDTVKPGDILDFAGGTLTMNKDGSSTHTYTDASGKQQSYTFNKGTDFATVARSDPNIAAEWKGMFNYTPPATLTGGTGGTSTPQPAGPVLTPGTGTAGSVTQTPTGWTPPVAPPTRVPTSIEDFNTRYNNLKGDSAAVYNHLMTGAAEPKSTTNKGPIVKPYWEAVGSKAPTYTDPTKGKTDPNTKPTTTPDEGMEWTYNTAGKIWKQTPIGGSSSSSNTDPKKPPTESAGEGYYWDWNGTKWVAVQYGPGIARGGMIGYATGGLGSLGGYSDGGQLLRGGGDGVSDSIPASIGGRQPARLADGEFVVPARIVSELGNGSTEAGARRLYQMMDRVQGARKKSIGKNKVATNSRAEQYLPA